MQLTVFASGSSGNCLLVSGGTGHVLVDAGISARRIEACLREMDLGIENIGGVLISHEHSDHISGLRTLIKKYPIKLFAPRTVAYRLEGMLPDSREHMTVIPVGQSFNIAGMDILAFHTPHDTDESVGYRIQTRGVFAVATDMGHVSDEVEQALSGADTVLIESNHDELMLRYGSYPVYLKRRILSPRGHLSNADCAALAARLVQRGTKRVVLGHLSRENNSPAKAMSETARALEGSGAELYCAPASGRLSVPISDDEVEPCSMLS